MAHVYFKTSESLDGPYASIERVSHVTADERASLELLVREYIVAAGDIGQPEAAREHLAVLRQEMRDDGHVLIGLEE
jgi:hypothetical protein